MSPEKSPSQEKSPRSLVLLRHAKAEHVAGRPDADRVLTSRGRADAAAAGRWLAAAVPVVDLVLCSTSARTRETWSCAEAAGASAREVRFEAAIYNGSVDALLELIRAEVEDTVRTLMVVGHAPGVPDLTGTLLATSAEAEAEAEAGAEAGAGAGAEAGAAARAGAGVRDAAVAATAGAGHRSAAARQRLGQGFPTTGLALLGVPVTWSDLAPGTASLQDFAVPRG